MTRMRCDMNLILLKNFLDYYASIEFEILLDIVCQNDQTAMKHFGH